MLGSVGVTTTVAISGLALISLLVLAVEQNGGPIGSALVLTDGALFRGQIWRLVTWPIAIVSSTQIFGQFLSAVFFFMIGGQLEGQLGRRAYTWLVGLITVVPAILGSVVASLTDIGAILTGLSVLFLGVAVAFAAARPEARSFFGIPFWILVAVIFVLTCLQDLANGNTPSLVMHITSAALGLVLIASMGHAPTLDWAPTVSLPGAMTTQGASRPPKAKKRPRKSKASSGHLRAVPTATAASEAEIDALLDQVSDQGIESLTKQQKQTLERHAKEMRKRRDL